MAELNGLLVIDKPQGVTSMDVVRVVRRTAGGVKTGHAGTLDPLATGVVICCIGRATKQVDSLMGLTKVYETCVDLSAFTSTDDREGPLEPVTVQDPPSEIRIRSVLPRFIGEIQQVPPTYSAVHVRGKRAYQLARRGQSVDIPPRSVRIDSIELITYDWPNATLRVTCGKGTYIRSIARDLGLALGTGGHAASLRRTAVGPFAAEQAILLDRVPNPVTQSDLRVWQHDDGTPER